MHLGGVGGGGGGSTLRHTNAYKGGGGRSEHDQKYAFLYAGLLKMLQYLKHLRIDATSRHGIRSAHVKTMIHCLGCFHI